MNLFSYFREHVIAAVEALQTAGTLPQELDLSRIAVEPPRDPGHGDIATNAAMVLSKPAGMKPRDLAGQLQAYFEALDEVMAVEVAGPGFLNLRLAPGFWHRRLAECLRAGESWGDSTIGTGRRVNVEYVSANPTGPMHVGHARGAVVGDALAGLLARAGFDVCREYYINDAGAQVDVLARSAFLRYREALGEEVGKIPEGLYPGDYLVPVGQALAERHGRALLDQDEAEWLPIVRETTIATMMEMIREDLAALRVRHDVFTSERELVTAGRVDEAVADLKGRDLLYTGVLAPPKGKLPDDWEERPQLLFRATEFGDDVDRPLQKSDGAWTYFASDIAYHRDKWRRGFEQLIDVWGADHGGYVSRVGAAVKAVTGGAATLDVKLCQLVRLMRAGEPVKMSKRAGTFVTLREVVDEVGADVVRFIMLTRRNDAAMDFDLKSVTEQSRENPVFYVQYAHARVSSVLRQAREHFAVEELTDTALAEVDLSCLDDPEEIAVLRMIAGWPNLIEGAAEAHEPHRLAFFMYDLASAFHTLWNKGREQAELRFILADERERTRARLALVAGVGATLRSGLATFNVSAPETM